MLESNMFELFEQKSYFGAEIQKCDGDVYYKTNKN